jgi:RHH-type transcriptional regulator, proline utilization regulon repressor / proline dehydrogenase / delta 1-pyrroline-5-carboxylate dehydrogenase
VFCTAIGTEHAGNVISSDPALIWRADNAAIENQIKPERSLARAMFQQGLNMTSDSRSIIRQYTLKPESECVPALLSALNMSEADRATVSHSAARLVSEIRESGQSGLMEQFLAEYGLNTDEGVALMCLAEAYLRTPDAETLDALISDKIGGGNWSRHLGRADSALVNASTWALMLSGRVFRTIPAHSADLTTAMRATVRRLGEPVARAAIGEAMRLMGRQFVLGRTIEEALENSAADRAAGYKQSFDMLGEAARTARDATIYFGAYAHAIAAIGQQSHSDNVHENPGISVKLSALHPRYESVNHTRIMTELVPRIIELARMAKAVNIPLAIDAEEADRLDLSLDVVGALLAERALYGWHGFGVVVQAYTRRAPAVLDWLYARAQQYDRQISVRLVKGAYWDYEIKNAQILGLADYPVFTRKETTDLSFLVCAAKLLDMTSHIFPQFATHNAHTVYAINHMADGKNVFEFQRLHGMGEALHELTRAEDKRQRRIYAPVGVHKDLLAYLVRRLLENGANSSFVHQILDSDIAPEEITQDPVARVASANPISHPAIPLPGKLYREVRKNSRGWNLNDPAQLAVLEAAMRNFANVRWGAESGRAIRNPANHSDLVGYVADDPPQLAEKAITAAINAFDEWGRRSPDYRADILETIADLYELHTAELMAICVREAGKNRFDAVAEIREAVDFLRYYAAMARELPSDRKPLGAIVCISPWNFPLAIFTGQIAGALAAGNTVVAKPAEQTPLIAMRAVELFLEAGIPEGGLQLVQGDGAKIGPALTGDPRIAGVAFTGSVETARNIDRSMAKDGNPDALLIAETGGLNAMIVDSTALPEQAVRDIVVSSFQSAGQRCSALRIVFIQKEVAPKIVEMLEGAVRELKNGDPWDPATDIGPVIDDDAQAEITEYCSKMEKRGRLLFRMDLPKNAEQGTYVPPAAFRVGGMNELEREIFGPVLHVAEFDADQLDALVDSINAAGYGLTLGIHSRIDNRVDRICERARTGNIYVNRNQIGAVVGVQPFGGEGLSGTGPKAGGPHYITRFTRGDQPLLPDTASRLLNGPTGERNSYMLVPRGVVVIWGADRNARDRLCRLVEKSGNRVLDAVPGSAEFDTALADGIIDAVFVDGKIRREWRVVLADAPGRHIPVIHADGDLAMLYHERSISEDTTASGGNATLLSKAV